MTSPTAPSDDRRRRLIIETVAIVATAIVIAIVLQSFFVKVFRIPSGSMEDQLMIGDRVAVSLLAYELHDLNRGDIIVFDCPPAASCGGEADEPGLFGRITNRVLESLLLREPEIEEFIKRVVGLPGETVEGRGGTVFIDGQRLVEPYLSEGVSTSDFGPVVIGEGEVWVLGDNRGGSADSRMFGSIDSETVVGRAAVKVWPPAHISFL